MHDFRLTRESEGNGSWSARLDCDGRLVGRIWSPVGSEYVNWAHHYGDGAGAIGSGATLTTEEAVQGIKDCMSATPTTKPGASGEEGDEA